MVKDTRATSRYLALERMKIMDEKCCLLAGLPVEHGNQHQLAKEKANETTFEL